MKTLEISNINSILSACLPPGNRETREITGAVSRVYGDPIDVWVRAGKPAKFVWRGRLYTVLRIFEHWVVSREWWRQRGEDPGEPADREFWRVEASPGRGVSAATYELRRDDATGTWLLARVWD